MFTLQKKISLFVLISVLTSGISHCNEVDNDLKCLFYDLQNPSPTKHKEAIAELVKIGKPAVEPLILNLNYTSQYLPTGNNVRAGIIEVLGKIRDERAIEPLIKILYAKFILVGNRIVPAPGSRIEQSEIDAAIIALANIGEPAIEPLMNCIKSSYESGEDRAPGRAVNALNNMGKPAMQSLIDCVNISNNSYWSIRNSASKELKKMDYQPLTKEAQINFLVASGNWEELIKIGPDARESLLVCLKEPDWTVRMNVLETLASIGGGNEPEPYIMCLQDKDKTIRLLAVNALEKMNYRLTSQDREMIALMSASNLDEQLSKLGAESVETLIKCLKNRDRIIPSKVAICLGKIGDKRAVVPLIDCLQNDDTSLCWSAIEALGNLRDERAIEPLIEHLGDNEGTTSRVITALRKIRDKQIVQPLLTWIEKQKGPVPSPVLYTLEQLGYKPSTPEMQVVFEVFRNELSYDVSSYGTTAIKPLMGLLGEQQEIREKAIESLVKIGKPSIVQLISRFGENINTLVQQEILIVLGSIGDDNATEFLTSVCLTDHNWEVRREAAIVLGKIGTEKASDALITCVNKELNEQVRTSAAESLGDIKNAKAIEPLVMCLEDPDFNVRKAAATSLDKMGYKQLTIEIQIHSLISRMQWNDLAETGTPAVEPLISCLKDNSQNIRQGAAESLGKIGDKKAIQPLTVCLGDTYPQVRGAAAEGLGNIGDKQAVEPIVQRLKKEYDHQARGKFIEALAKLRDDKVVPDIVGCMPDWFNRVTIRSTLTGFGWQPSTSEQNVYWHIAGNEKEWLNNNGTLVKQVLIADANSYITQKFEHSVYAVLEFGYNNMIPELIEIINNMSSREMIMTIRRCGNEELEKAAAVRLRQITPWD